jgi:hypothetical protein
MLQLETEATQSRRKKADSLESILMFSTHSIRLVYSDGVDGMVV